MLQGMGAAAQRVLLLFPPGLDYIAAFFGCLYAGSVAVPVYMPRHNRHLHRLQAIISDARPAVALTNDTLMSQLESRLSQTSDIALRWIAIESIDNLAEQWQDPCADERTLAFLQYTSGSTANPKGVMISHGNLLDNERKIQAAFAQTERSIVVGWLPLFHDMGLIGNVLQPLYVGAECILLSPMSFLQKPFRWLDAISRYRATTSGGPNFAYDLCVSKIAPDMREGLDLTNWSVAFDGSEPVRNETIGRFCAAFESCGFRRRAFFPCYGLAEATLFVTGGPSATNPRVRTVRRDALEEHRVSNRSRRQHRVQTLVSCGATPRNRQIRVVDPESLIECPRNHVGEIWVSGQSVAQGYWNRP
jgi:acyl-CoA synthetase (AMP-forming)/AMP-acid ligase II